MLHKDVIHHKYHYGLLIVIEAILLSLFVTSHDQVTQGIIALTIGIFYFFWGVGTHAGSYRPLRLMLEYAVVGLLASVILIILIGSV